jgi:hypothetical protein
MLLSLNAFVLGGCAALTIVYRLLDYQLAVYAATGSMGDVSVILDLMDDLTLPFLAYGGVLTVLLSATAGVWAWMAARSPLLRYGAILLLLATLLVLGGTWLSRGTEDPVVLPATPTPTIQMQEGTPVARLTAKAVQHLHEQLGVPSQDIRITSVRPLLPLCDDPERCPVSWPGYIIHLRVEDRVYEYSARMLQQTCILWREA